MNFAVQIHNKETSTTKFVNFPQHDRVVKVASLLFTFYDTFSNFFFYIQTM